MIATLESPSSVAVACVEAVQETTAPAEEVASTDAGAAAQVTVGGVESTTVTVKRQLSLFPAASVAIQKTVVVPIGKVLPEGWL